MALTLSAPADLELHPALRLAGAFALVKFLLHLAMNVWQAHHGWGYFRDEFYFIACGRHLAWGYVDHGPLVAVQARLAETLFGRSLAGIRMLSALAGAARVFLTGVLAWSLGGRRAAQSLAMLGVLLAPCYLGADGYLSMNSVESLFWMSALLVVMLLQRGGSPKLWLLFGVAAGLGLLNKPSMTFFLAALLIALLLTPQRRVLTTPWLLAGCAVMLVIAAPNLIWQMHNHWATWEFLRNDQQGKNRVLGPFEFLDAQWQTLNPLSAAIWLPGLVWLLRRRDVRWLGLTYVLFLGLMFKLHAKDYYVIPIYPILFAAGGLAWQTRLASARVHRVVAFPVLQVALVMTAILILPMAEPLLSPTDWLRYTAALHLRNRSGDAETAATGPLPQFFADRFGWQEEADAVRRIYRSLTPAEQAQTVVLCTNYGQAGALQFLAPELPVVVSGHNNYWLWGAGPRPGNILIDFERGSPEHFRDYFSDVQAAGKTQDSRWSMPYERRTIWLLKGAHQTIQSLWPSEKDYI